MRIDGKKPNPANLADIVSSIDDEENGVREPAADVGGFGDEVGIPVEPVPAPAPVVEKAERRGRKKAAPEPVPQTPDLTIDEAAFLGAPAEQPSGKPMIEHNVPIPPHGNVGAVRYPFRDMKTGDSFFVKQEAGESRKKLSARVRSASAQFRRRSTGEVVSFTTRMEKNGIRVWRTS